MYRARLEVADTYLIGLSELSQWPADDRDAAIGLRLYKSECCPECAIHPSLWRPELGGNLNAVVPTWKWCRVCELVDQAQKAGPPSETPGWHLTLHHNHKE